MRNKNVTKIALSGILIAVGIIIPMFSPIRVMIEPASFTLGSHIVIFIAMFISPTVAISVALGTTLGFFLGGFPLVIVARAASHVIFAGLGSYYLHNVAKEKLSVVKLRVFSFWVAIIHATGELVVVSLFYFDNNVTPIHFEQGFLFSVLLLVGLGSVIHSLVDFELARIVILPLKSQKNIASWFSKH